MEPTDSSPLLSVYLGLGRGEATELSFAMGEDYARRDAFGPNATGNSGDVRGEQQAVPGPGYLAG
jgi:hypothetical protein